MRALTTAAREVLAPAACRSTTVVAIPRLTSDGGQRQPGRAGSDDEDIGVVCAVHLLLLPTSMPTLVGITMRLDVPYVNSCWHTLVGMRRSSAETKAVILAAARERFAAIGLRAGHHPGDRRGRQHRPVDGDALLRQQGPAVRRRGRLRLAASRSVRRRPRRSWGARLVDHFMDRWERDEVLIVLLRSSATNAEAAQRMRSIFASQLLPAIAKINPDAPRTSRGADRDADARAGVVPIRAAAAADRRPCRTTRPSPGSGPTVQRYLDGALDNRR